MEAGGVARAGLVLARAHSHGKILETHFDSDLPQQQQHARSSSYSTVPGHHPAPAPVNLNNSFPGSDSAPYISSSVTLPAVSGAEQGGFYHNLSGRVRQPSLRHKPEAGAETLTPRHSGAWRHLAGDLHKSPRTQELEEFAAKFEGYQKQRTRRLAAQPTPMLDQLARETNHPQLWQLQQLAAASPESAATQLQLSTLESSLLRLVQRQDSRCARQLGMGQLYSEEAAGGSSGRESVQTVISTSSSETIKARHSRHSSSETLRYCDTEAAAVICDDPYGGPGPAPAADTNYNSWRVKQSNNNNNNNPGYWETHKRSLYRSHSEAGTVLRSGDVMDDMNGAQWQQRDEMNMNVLQREKNSSQRSCDDMNGSQRPRDNLPGLHSSQSLWSRDEVPGTAQWHDLGELTGSSEEAVVGRWLHDTQSHAHHYCPAPAPAPDNLVSTSCRPTYLDSGSQVCVQ